MAIKEDREQQESWQARYRRDEMETKQYLNRISELDRMINNKLSELSQLKMMAYGVTAFNDGERVQASGDKDRLGNTVAKIVDMEKEIDKFVDQFVDLKKEILQMLSMLESQRHKQILFKKYFEYKSIYTIADELGMSDRGCKKAHKRALEEFEKIKNHNILCFY